MDYDVFYEPGKSPGLRNVDPDPALAPTREVRNGRIGVSLVFWVAGCSFATWASRIPMVKHHLMLTDLQLGYALFALGTGALLGFPIAGIACARIGSKPATVALGLTYCLTLALIPLATGLPSLMAILAAFGLFHGALDVSMNSNGVEVEGRYGRSIMSSLHGMFSLGSLSGATVGMILTRLQVSTFAFLTGGSAIFLLCMIWAGKSMLGEKPTGHLDHPVFAIPSRPLIAIGLIVTCSFLCEGAMGDWSGVYLRDSLKTTTEFAVSGYVAYSLMMTVSRFFGDRILNRWGPVQVVRVAGSIAAVGFALALAVGTPYSALVGFGCVGLGMSTIAPIGFGAAGRTEGMNSGSAIAAVASMGYSGFLVGPPIIGLISEHTGLRLALGIVALLSAVIVLLAGSASHGRLPANP